MYGDKTCVANPLERFDNQWKIQAVGSVDRYDVEGDRAATPGVERYCPVSAKHLILQVDVENPRRQPLHGCLSIVLPAQLEIRRLVDQTKVGAIDFLQCIHDRFDRFKEAQRVALMHESDYNWQERADQAVPLALRTALAL